MFILEVLIIAMISSFPPPFLCAASYLDKDLTLYSGKVNRYTVQIHIIFIQKFCIKINTHPFYVQIHLSNFL